MPSRESARGLAGIGTLALLLAVSPCTRALDAQDERPPSLDVRAGAGRHLRRRVRPGADTRSGRGSLHAAPGVALDQGSQVGPPAPLRDCVPAAGREHRVARVSQCPRRQRGRDSRSRRTPRAPVPRFGALAARSGAIDRRRERTLQPRTDHTRDQRPDDGPAFRPSPASAELPLRQGRRGRVRRGAHVGRAFQRARQGWVDQQGPTAGTCRPRGGSGSCRRAAASCGASSW